jgi:hypothetical protein
MAKKPLESTKVVDNTTTQNQILKPKDIGNKKSNFSKLFKKYQTIIISFALVLVLLVGGSLAYFQIQRNNTDNASAGLNCDTANGFTASGATCVKTETINKICADSSVPVNGKCSITQNTVTGYFCPTEYNQATQSNFNNTGRLFGGVKDVSNNCVSGMGSPVFGQSSPGVPTLVIDCSSPRFTIVGFGSGCYQEDQGAIIYGFGGSQYCGITQIGTNPVPPYANYIIESGGYRICASGVSPNGNNLFGVLLSRVYGGFSYSASQIITPTTVLVDATCSSGGYTSDGVNSNTCSKTLTQTTEVTYTPNNGDVTGITCDKTNYTENTNANCTITVKGAPTGVPYTGKVIITVNTGGGQADCNLSGTSTTQTCNPVNVGPTTGGIDTSKEITTDKGGNLGITVTPSLITVTNANLKDALADCTNKTVVTASSYNCTFALVNGYKFPATGNFQSTTATNDTGITAQSGITPANCTYTANATTGNLTCNSIPTPSGLTSDSNRNILLRLGTGTEEYTDKGNVNVTTNLITVTNDNLTDALENCTNKTTDSGIAYDCTFALKAGYKFPTTGDFKAATSTTDNGTTEGTTSPNCTYTADATTGNLTCNDIPAGTNSGNREILLRLGTTGNYTDKGDVSVNTSLITVTNDNLNLALEDCTNKTVASGATYNCTFALKAGYKFPATSNFRATTSTGNNITAVATTPASCTAVTDTSTTLTCNNIPSDTNSTTSDVARNILLRLGIATETYTDKGGVTITAGTTDTLLIPKTATTITESPNPEAAGLSIYGKSDYSLTVKDARLNKVGTVDTFCYFKIKEATAIDGNSDKGYEKLTSTVNGGLGVLTSTTSGAAYDTTTKSYKVTYDNTNGANIKLASGKQLYTDYNLQIRCTRSDSQAFARDQKINFLFGAYSVVDISGQV